MGNQDHHNHFSFLALLHEENGSTPRLDSGCKNNELDGKVRTVYVLALSFRHSLDH